MKKFVFGILVLTLFFVASILEIPQALGQDGCSDPPTMCTSDADCSEPEPKCNMQLGVCEALPSECQTDADCSGCTPICDMDINMCVGELVEEQGCDELEGAAFGLCNAYCEAMDCDGEPQASDKACEKVLGNYEKITGEVMPPCSVSE